MAPNTRIAAGGEPTAVAAGSARTIGSEGPRLRGAPAAARHAALELPVGAELCGGRFGLRRVIGRGGFGITYEADDRRLQRRVAVKELFPDPVARHGTSVVAPPHAATSYADAKRRFLREARTLAKFSHPGIVRIFEVFEEHNTVYLVLELLEGRTLAELALRAGAPLRDAEIVDLVVRVADALGHVHGSGVLHRDVNPANLVLTSSGRLVLIDFGIAHPFAEAGAPATRLVTPGYAPPEQYRSSGELSPAADVYGLAATAYRLGTGVMVPAAPERLAGVGVTAPWRLNSSVSKSVSDAILDGLELSPGHRPRDVAAFVARFGCGDVGVAPRSLLVERAVAAPGAPDPHPAEDRVPRPPVGERPAPDRQKGRTKVLAPIAVAAVAFGSSTPTVATTLAVVVALPTLATLGDLALHRDRQRPGAALPRWQALPPRVVAVPRLVRNVGVSVVRAVPALVFCAVMIVAALLLGHSGAPPVLRSVALRLGGGLAMVGLVVAAARAGAGFRVEAGLTAVSRRLLDGRGRLVPAGWATLIVAVALTAAGLWLRPDPWPL